MLLRTFELQLRWVNHFYQTSVEKSENVPGKQKESAICNVWLVYTKGNGELKYDRRHMRTRICFFLYSLLFHNHYSIFFLFVSLYISLRNVIKWTGGKIKNGQMRNKTKEQFGRETIKCFLSYYFGQTAVSKSMEPAFTSQKMPEKHTNERTGYCTSVTPLYRATQRRHRAFFFRAARKLNQSPVKQIRIIFSSRGKEARTALALIF